MKRALLIVAGAGLFIGVLSLYVTLSVASDLRAVKETLDADTRELTGEAVLAAETRLQSARERLNSLPARMLRLVPVIGQNLGSIDQVVEASIPALQSALELSDALGEVDRQGLVRRGRIDLDAIRSLERPLEIQNLTLSALVEELKEGRNGWLVPPLWSALDRLLQRSEDLLEGSRKTLDFLSVSDDLLGARSERTYLVLLINNSETRGAGGILSAVGTIGFDRGRLRLGRFRPVHELRDRPPVPVPAPDEFVERFGVFQADTTLWLNTSYSPDVPDVALVASRLFELKTGRATDGALTIDPRGIAALLPPDAEVELPRDAGVIPADRAAEFIYSDAYELFRGDQVARREAILRFGRQAFRTAIQSGLGGEEGLLRLAGALAGEHIRFTSFATAEEEVLEDIGATGALGPARGTTPLMITTQNFGGGNGQGSKLDFWARRSIDHACVVDRSDPIRCTTETSIRNDAPEGLSAYVAGRDGAIRSFLETYVPDNADILAVQVDGEDVEFRPAEQAGHLAIGVFVEVPRGRRSTVRVTYELPPAEDDFHLVVTPQPLPSDAQIEVRLRIPDRWVVVGPGTLDGEVFSFEGELDSTIAFRSARDPRTGISGLWEGFRDFLRDPLF